MASPTKQSKFKRKGPTDASQGIEIKSTSPSPVPHININIAKSLCQDMQSTFRVGNGTVSPRSVRGIQAQFTVSMDEAYDYKIGSNEFDSETIFPESLPSVTNFQQFCRRN
ncbi:hypothetical protein VN97_g4409 [Penicillium thymicola]|uniref:Uncharacterized protein n=1 Tax=Penicillium thymicola TaxID=293382 RepID=A0AAI9X9Y0_PENTH|nr:hypothetical protein VN97_g4409 [Penicillium thymicola]